MMRVFFTVLFLAFSFNAWGLEIRSGAFENGEALPAKYTCDLSDFSPPLSWGDVPSGTESFAIICDDPDASFAAWTHWVIFNIPGEARELKEDFSPEDAWGGEVIEGLNDFGRAGYGGPCPPPGKVHHYFFKLYALDSKLSLGSEIGKKDLLKAIEGHILAEAKIVGLYERRE